MIVVYINAVVHPDLIYTFIYQIRFAIKESSIGDKKQYMELERKEGNI